MKIFKQVMCDWVFGAFSVEALPSFSLEEDNPNFQHPNFSNLLVIFVFQKLLFENETTVVNERAR